MPSVEEKHPDERRAGSRTRKADSPHVLTASACLEGSGPASAERRSPEARPAESRRIVHDAACGSIEANARPLRMISEDGARTKDPPPRRGPTKGCGS